MAADDRGGRSRSGWIVAVERIGIASVTVLILLVQLPGALKDAVAGDAKVRAAQHDALLKMIDQSTETNRAVEASLRGLSENIDAKLSAMSATTKFIEGMASGRNKCPPCPKCPDIPPCPACPAPTALAVPEPVSTPRPAPAHRRDR